MVAAAGIAAGGIAAGGGAAATAADDLVCVAGSCYAFLSWSVVTQPRPARSSLACFCVRAPNLHNPPVRPTYCNLGPD